MGWVEGHGTTSTPHDYHHTVTGLEAGLHRFRLKQVDFDGTSTYSPEVEVTLEGATSFGLSAPYPNPARAETRVRLRLQRTEVVVVSVYDALGRRVRLLHEGMVEGGHTTAFEVETGGWPGGVYVIRAEGETFRAAKSVFVLK